MPKLLFFDIDGTLCMPGKAPSPRTVEAIQKARANGHKVFLSTGRNITGIPKAVNDIGFDGYITNAGACAQVYTYIPQLSYAQRRYFWGRIIFLNIRPVRYKP